MYGPILSYRRLDPSAATKELSEELAWLGVELNGTRSEVEWARIAAEEHHQARFSAADLAAKEREERTVWEQLAAEAEVAKAALISQLRRFQAQAAEAPAQVTASIVAKAEEAATEIDIDDASKVPNSSRVCSSVNLRFSRSARWRPTVTLMAGLAPWLSTLLQASPAQPRLRTERVVQSAIYDLDYRVFVIAAAFEIHAKESPADGRQIHATKLKLLQFVAIRPRLLPVIKAWSAGSSDEDSKFDAYDIRRGFLGDRMFDSVVAFLVARGALDWSGLHIKASVNVGLLTSVYQAAENTGLFAAERRTLIELADIRLTVRMLEGV